MTATAAACLALSVSLLGPAQYAARAGRPLQLGNLTDVQLGSSLANRWVQGRGALGGEALEYQRPPQIPPIASGSPPSRTIRAYGWRSGCPRTSRSSTTWRESFVGRLVPLDGAGLAYRHPGCRRGCRSITASWNTWLLLDGEAPSTSRWVFGVLALLSLFVVFSIGGVIHLLRPVRDA